MCATRSRPAKMDSMSLVIFGDGTSDISALLQKLLLLVPHSASQSEFIRHTGIALRAQVQLICPGQRQSLPPFTSIHDLLRIYQESNGICHPAISSVLICIAQLLQVFKYAALSPFPYSGYSFNISRKVANSRIAILAITKNMLIRKKTTQISEWWD